MKIQFPDLKSFGYSKFLQSSDFRATDTIYVARVEWDSMITDSLKLEKNKVLKTWLIEDSGFKNIEIFSN